ncbi:hypothetical protein [Pseudolysinimonas sp.]|jgi:hypothetical protein|uniref:hypothetical protein n=1 Tax=Pseudolysinimonas sp. TaxID=2680009 RepID=UPI0037850F3B
MTLLHPSRAGSSVAVWFVRDRPVRLVSGGSRFRVLGEPKCADINGVRYWRVRACSEAGEGATFDLRASDDGWVLDGVDENSTRAGVS